MHMHACRQVEHAPLEIAPSWKLPPKQPQRKPADRPHVSTSPLQRRVHTQRELGTLTRVCRNLAPRDGLVSALPLLTTVYSELLAAGTPARQLLQGLLQAMMQPVAAYMRAWALQDQQDHGLHEHGPVQDMPAIADACLQVPACWVVPRVRGRGGTCTWVVVLHASRAALAGQMKSLTARCTLLNR